VHVHGSLLGGLSTHPPACPACSGMLVWGAPTTLEPSCSASGAAAGRDPSANHCLLPLLPLVAGSALDHFRILTSLNNH
jgi:hypothetical protein